MSEIKFQNAVEARSYYDTVHDSIKSISGYNYDLRKLYQNCCTQIDELSRLEIRARQSKNYKPVEKKILDMHEEIGMVEKWVLMLTLMEPEN